MSIPKLDATAKEYSYWCECGKFVRVPFAELVAGSKDYCGCGLLATSFLPGDVAEHHKALGVPEIEE